MKAIFQTSQIKKDFKRIKKRGKDLTKMKEVVSAIATGEALQERHRDHALSGNWSGSRDCQIEPDWIRIYRVDGDFLFLERTGSHSDLFRSEDTIQTLGCLGRMKGRNRLSERSARMRRIGRGGEIGPGFPRWDVPDSWPTDGLATC